MMSLKRSFRRLRARGMSSIAYRGLQVPIRGAHINKYIIDELMESRYEKPEIDALLQLVRPTDRIMEVGVGLGVVSSLASRVVPDGQVACYEANPDLMTPIRHLHDTNGITNVIVHNAILVRGPGGDTRDFHVHASFAESSLIASDGTVRTVQVPTVSLEETLKSFGPDILVMDIEGGEAELLPGLALDGVRAAVVEFHPAMMTPADQAAIFSSFNAAGLFPRVELSTANVVAFERLASGDEA